MKPDWVARLSEYIRSHRDKPFVWGERDCMLFAAGAYQAMTGKDVAEPYRGYSTAQEAKRVLRSHGGAAALVDKHFQRKPVIDLATGDWGLIRLEDREFVAVVYNQWAITPGAERQVMNPVMQCSIGWRVYG